MKRLIALFLCALLLLAGCAAPAPESQAESTQPLPADTPLCDGETLKILAIGNSFSDDSMKYLFQIAQAEGIQTVVLGKLYIGGCSLSKHMNNATGNLPAYTYYKNTTGSWEKTESATLQQGLTDEDWDLITLQQVSGQSGLLDSYYVLPQLINYVNATKTNPDAKLIWHMTWAYQHDSTHADFVLYANNQEVMYKQILAATQERILTNDAISAVIPAGTAIQNARSSYFGDKLTRDGYHLNELGRLIAGYTWYAALTGKPLEQLRLNTYADGELSDSDQQVIIEAVNNALAKPMEATPSQISQPG